MLELCTDFQIVSIFSFFERPNFDYRQKYFYKFGRVFDSPSEYAIYKWIRSSECIDFMNIGTS